MGVTIVLSGSAINEFDISEINDGYYILKVVENNSIVYNKQVIIIK